MSVASGGFFGEGAPITVGSLLDRRGELANQKSRQHHRGDARGFERLGRQCPNQFAAIAGRRFVAGRRQILLDAIAADAIRPAGLRTGVAGLAPAAAGTPTEKAVADIGALVGAIMPASKPVLIVAGRQAVAVAAYMPGMPVIAAPLLAAGTLICVDANAFREHCRADRRSASGEAVLHMEKPRRAADRRARCAGWHDRRAGEHVPSRGDELALHRRHQLGAATRGRCFLDDRRRLVTEGHRHENQRHHRIARRARRNPAHMPR